MIQCHKRNRSSNRFHLDNPRCRNSTGGNCICTTGSNSERVEESRGEEEILAAENVKVEEPWREFGRSSQEALRSRITNDSSLSEDIEILEFHFQGCLKGS